MGDPTIKDPSGIDRVADGVPRATVVASLDILNLFPPIMEVKFTANGVVTNLGNTKFPEQLGDKFPALARAGKHWRIGCPKSFAGNTSKAGSNSQPLNTVTW